MTYRSYADVGGELGHGAVTPEPEGELFHAEWEPSVLALTLAMAGTGQWNLDASRSARETLPNYAVLTYYEVWHAALEAMMRERGLVFDDELDAGHALHPPVPVARVLEGARVPAGLAAGSPTRRPATAPAHFAVGDTVRTRDHAVDHHTRLPGYVLDRRGVVERVHGMHVFPDAHARFLGEQPQWLYTVVFDAADLWPDGRCGDTVSVDAWEPYLRPDDGTTERAT